jgi:hypothetical protein
VSDEQEMQFADPAWQPKVTREFEALAPIPSPAEASRFGTSTGTTSQVGEADYIDYAQGYRAQSTQTSGRESPSPNPPPLQNQQRPPFQGQQPSPAFQDLSNWLKRVPTWVWWVVGIIVLSNIVQSSVRAGGPGGIFGLLFLALLIFIGWALWTRHLRVNLSGEVQAAETRTFTVGAQPLIVLKNKAGSINLRAGQEGQVSITTTRRGYVFSQHFTKETPITFSQDSATNTVTARTGSWRLFGQNTISFDVAVPPQANLELRTNFGNITVQNVAGQLTLRADAGSIQATDVALQGKSRLKADAGTIVFSGSLDPAGNYELVTDLGTINATLPADASFDLNARTDVGTVATNLPLPQAQRNRLQGSVGNGPRPRLKVKTDLGTINVQRGQ